MSNFFYLSNKIRKIKILVKVVQNCDLSKSLKSPAKFQFRKSLIFSKNFQNNLFSSKEPNFIHNFETNLDFSQNFEIFRF